MIHPWIQKEKKLQLNRQGPLLIRALLLLFLIGTFQAETNEEIAYGLVHPLASWDPVWIQVRINRFPAYHDLIFSLFSV